MKLISQHLHTTISMKMKNEENENEEYTGPVMSGM